MVARTRAETVDAQERGDIPRSLIPWDERPACGARLEDLREALVREYLREVRSGLLEESDRRDVYRRMQLTTRLNDHEVPRNVGLLLFSRNPAQWFRGAEIEVVQFAADRAGNVQEERTFGGGLVDQLCDCLNYLSNLTVGHLHKLPDRPRARRWVNYPLPALREALVNAVYHRSYDVDQPEPTKVYLHPDRVEVISYPGPVPGIEPEDLIAAARARAVPARNRRIGEYLKELGFAEGRLTGLPKIFRAMRDNGSPPPLFEFDSHRTFFQVTLPAHPEYVALTAVRDAAHLRALGEHEAAIDRIESAWATNKASEILAAETIRALAAEGEIDRAEAVLMQFEAHAPPSVFEQVRTELAETLLNAGKVGRIARRRPRSTQERSD